MQPVSGSEFYPARDARTPLTRGFLLGHRHRTQTNAPDLPHPSFVNPHTPVVSRCTPSNSRRKRSSETVFLTHQDGGGKAQQENKGIRTSCSHSPVSTETSNDLLRSTSHRAGDADSIALRVKVRQFSATARSATGACTASTSAFVPACCSNARALSAHKSSAPVFKPPLRLHSTNVSSPFVGESGGRSFTSSGPSRTRSHIKLPAVRPGKAKASAASPSSFPSSPSPSPANFDVAHTNLAPGTCTTSYRDRVDSFFDTPSSSTFLFPSFDALDDLTRWGMDAMSFISTSPDNHGQDATNIDQITSTNIGPNTNDSTFSNPFSTPFGDDDFLENEIPFPSTRPRVVLEPMGIKKSKTLAADKARSLTPSNSSLTSNSRHRLYDLSLPDRPASVLERSSTPRSPGRPPPTLPHPLPTVQSVQSPSPLNDDSLARTSSYLQRIAKSSQPSSASVGQVKRKATEGDVDIASGSPNRSSSSNQELNSQNIPSAPLSSSDTESGNSKITLSGNSRRKPTPVFVPLGRKGSEGHQSLGPEDCELSVMFPQTAHYEVWDMSDHGWVSVPALLCLMVKDLKRWAATPLATPDVSLIELKCDDIPLPVRFTSLCPERTVMPTLDSSSRPVSPSFCRPNTYLTSFLGGKSALDESLFPQNGRSKKRRMSMMDVMRKHEEEQKMGKDKISLEGKWTRTFGLPGVGGCEIKRNRSGSSTHKETSSVPPRGWYLKFWIPIPTRLFLKRETRMFRIHAQIWMMDQEEEKPDRFETGLEDVISEWGRENDGVPSLEAKTEMSVSHLRRERDMDGWWW